MENPKHAYLIMAHNNFYVLEKLLKSIDDCRNDIYIHIDKKVKDDFGYLQFIPKRSKVYFTNKRYNVKWGGQSQVLTELLLYKTANLKNKYQYYHLLSGACLPLKSQKYIHDFFSKTDKNYISMAESISKWDRERVSKYHLGTDNAILKRIMYRIDDIFKIDRLKNKKMIIKKGANWCSLNNEVVEYLLMKKIDIIKLTWLSSCADELYKQTFIFNSKYKKSIFFDSEGRTNDLREIDWSEGKNSPRIYTSKDYDKLIKSNLLFARKFNDKIDKEIVDKIYNLCCSDSFKVDKLE